LFQYPVLSVIISCYLESYEVNLQPTFWLLGSGT